MKNLVGENGEVILYLIIAAVFFIGTGTMSFRTASEKTQTKTISIIEKGFDVDSIINTK